MTKYNYFQVPGLKEHDPKFLGVVYGRSKKDIGNKCSQEGFDVEEVSEIRELNFKEEVITMFSEKDLFSIRKHYKGMEKASTTPKAPKTK